MKQVFAILSASVLLFAACSKDNDAPAASEYAGEATLHFDSKVGSEDFALNKDFTIGSNTYSFTKLRYWVSDVKFVKSDGTEYEVPKSYYLIEETGAEAVQTGNYTYPANKREDVNITNIPYGDYTGIKFSIGVDSVHNNNLSLQAGELSQMNGMTNVSWMWQTSYIFSSLAGTMKSGATSQAFLAETGLNNNYKTVSLTLPETIRVSAAKSKGVMMHVDVATILSGIDMMATPTIGASEADAMAKLAGNYTTAVSVTNVLQ